MSMQMQVVVLFAMQNGYFDDVDVERIEECQAGLEEFMETRKADVLQLVADEKAVTDGVKALSTVKAVLIVSLLSSI